ncbi:MAG: DUF6884 domain-containing protein [Muribaculaceae bacterium]
MAQIVLIGCSKSKLDHCAPAKDFYQGSLFKKSLAAARKQYPKAQIYVLSAKYGLVPIDTVICPYDETLNGKPANHIKKWAANVTNQMKQFGINPNNDYFFIFAGNNYHKYLPLRKVTNMFAGCKGIGEILKKLNQLI